QIQSRVPDRGNHASHYGTSTGYGSGLIRSMLRQVLTATLKPLIILLFALTVLIGVTGGMEWRLEIGRIEANQVNVFVILFALFLFLYKKLTREPLDQGLGPVGPTLHRLGNLLEEPDRSARLAWITLGLVFG